MKQLTSYEGLHCANCGQPMQGEYCHACGQSIHSVIKPIHGLLEDTLDIVFHVDARVLHTLPPLFARPGFLTLEYFSGRRVRYIAPFRLMFVLSLLAFFVTHAWLESVTTQVNLQPQASVQGDAFRQADTAAAVRSELHRRLAELDQARASGVLPQSVLATMDTTALTWRRQANQRLLALGAAPMPAASVAPPPAASTPHAVGGSAKPVDAAHPTASHGSFPPVHVAWLPDTINARLTLTGKHLLANWYAFRDGDAASREEAKQRMLSGFFGVLPPTMFVLMPLFALLLKVFYLFKRRLYVEHLIVALHSHAFLFLNMLLGVLVHMLADGVRPHAPWLAAPLGWIYAGLWLWAPIYLLLMQKRVYRQGWPMTLLKYLLVGWCYCWMLLVALLIAGLLGLAH